MKKRGEQSWEIENAWRSGIADLELSGYNPYNKDGCFIQFAARGNEGWEGGDYIRGHYSMCVIAKLQREERFRR